MSHKVAFWSGVGRAPSHDFLNWCLMELNENLSHGTRYASLGYCCSVNPFANAHCH